MNLYHLLNLDREPFSNAPDPEMFFQSRQHMGCLQKVELAIHMRRGLSVVVGNVGTGKTTICRQLIRRLSKDPETETHLILDPDFQNPAEFLKTVIELLQGQTAPPDLGLVQQKEAIKNTLFKKNVEQEKKVVLIIDEGQKTPDFVLELLREFLNFETNEHKMLQIVVFAQTEFKLILEQHAYFRDRVSVFLELFPLGFRDTVDMIRFRLEQASAGQTTPDLFTWPAFWAIYQFTGGHPRQVVNLCHLCLMSLIIREKAKVGWFMVRACGQMTASRRALWGRRLSTVLALVLVVVLAAVFLGPDRLISWKMGESASTAPTEGGPTPGDRGSGPAAQNPSAGTGMPASDDPPAGAASPGTEAPWTSTAALPPGPGGASTALPIQKPPVEPPTAGSDPAGLDPAATFSTSNPVPGSNPAPPPVPGSGLAPVPTADPSGTPTGTGTAAVSTEPGPGPPVPPVPSGPERPAVLGRITVREGDNLSRLIKYVYGTYDPEYQAKVLQANPNLKPGQKLHVGRELVMPTIPAPVSKPKSPRYWVELGRAGNLEQAMDLFRRIRPGAPALYVMPYHTTREGLQFAVLMIGAFPSENDAKNRISGLPPALSASARVIPLWDDAAEFYANPFKVPKPSDVYPSGKVEP
jgi:general secretion pathway protein A